MPAPKRRLPGYWYGIGAALIAVGVIAGITVFIAAMVSVLQGPTDEFSGDGSVTAPFEAGTSKIIYLADTKASSAVYAHTRCTARDDKNRDATVSRYDGSLSINQWSALYVVSAPEDGNYTISCAGPSDMYYGVGPRASSAAKFAIFAGPFGGVCLAAAGLVVLIVTASRRRQAPPTYLGPPPYPGPGPYPYR
ncbi:hypothetical protein FZI91_18085 [Mycobacterium sp. CBMA271]|nr:hypothetical protein [Mycobacteroides sp. CBMA 326]MUM23592.1 hypothetical protein [Mycobacteroides sp. CBMA 271]